MPNQLLGTVGINYGIQEGFSNSYTQNLWKLDIIIRYVLSKLLVLKVTSDNIKTVICYLRLLLSLSTATYTDSYNRFKT